jgi:hypothetical protein
LACYEYLHACGLDVVDMDKNIGATVIGRDKAISAICVEEFDPPTWHAQLIQSSAKRVMPERVMPQKAACRRPNSDVLAREREGGGGACCMSGLTPNP